MNYTFDGSTKTITIKPGRCVIAGAYATDPTFDTSTSCAANNGTFTEIISVNAEDIYSSWKLWLTTQPAGALGQTTPAFLDSVGGNSIGSGLSLGSYYFLSADWIIAPDNRSHDLTIVGNLFSAVPGTPLIEVIAGETVSVAMNTSSLTQQIEVASSVAAADVAAAVWDADTSAHTTAGTFGEYINKKLLTFAKFLALK